MIEILSIPPRPLASSTSVSNAWLIGALSTMDLISPSATRSVSPSVQSSNLSPGLQIRTLVIQGDIIAFGEGKPHAQVHFGGLRAAQEAADDVRIGVTCDLLRGEEAAIQHFAHPGVVLAELQDASPAHEVNAAIAHTGGEELAADDQGTGDGGTQPQPFGMFEPVGIDLAAGSPDGIGERFRPVSTQAARHAAADGIHRHLGSHFPSRVPADAIGHHRQDGR